MSGTAVPPAVTVPLLEATGLSKSYQVRRGMLRSLQGLHRALQGVDLELQSGECFGLVGESGSGKTTLGRCLVRLVEPDEGRIWFRGEDLLALRGETLRRRRRALQMIFQDPYDSLNPRQRIGHALREPLQVHQLVPKADYDGRVAQLLSMVGLPAESVERFPHEFSGGQRQRIGIARALATEPDLLIADEPVSALDVSVRAQIVNLLVRLQRQLGLTVLFIAHDLALVEQVADRVAVLYLGRMVERAACRDLFADPQHPYVVSLLSAVPEPEPRRLRPRIVLRGELPSPLNPPAGCAFHPRCQIARPRCARERPPLVEVRPGHGVACHYPGELTLDGSRA